MRSEEQASQSASLEPLLADSLVSNLSEWSQFPYWKVNSGSLRSASLCSRLKHTQTRLLYPYPERLCREYESNEISAIQLLIIGSSGGLEPELTLNVILSRIRAVSHTEINSRKLGV